MCGIAGVYWFDPDHPVDVDLLVRQTDALVHRGPDDGGVWTAPGVGLGHRRLSIIDLGSGQQPMPEPTGRYTVTFNGEIYDFAERRVELEGLGHRFRTDSDTEVLLHAYIEWGEACVERLNGMFAFAIYDRDEHRLFLSRDRLGKKPLYVYRDRDRVVFASELKAIVVDGSVPKTIEPTAVADYFAVSYVPAPKTIYRGISKLPAGHSMVVADGAVRTKRYWDVRFGEWDDSGNLDHHADRLRGLIEDAVQLRLRSDVPLGAFLSGGVDSSAMVAVMSKLLPHPAKTCSIGFDVARFDERKYARQVAERFSTDHREQVLHAEAADVVQQLSWYYDEPFGDSSALPTFYLCGMTREHVTVAISGDGGDELFGGYSHYASSMWVDSMRQRVPRMLRSLALEPLRRMFGLSRYHPRAWTYNVVGWRLANERDRSAYDSLIPQPWRWRELLDRGFVDALDGYDPFDSVGRWYGASGTDDYLSRMQYADIKSYLVDDILVKVDRASMAHGLEVRCPLLDYRIVEYAATLPPALRLDRTNAKRVLKRAVADLIPPSFFDRPKAGFAIPLAEWFRSALKPIGAALFVDRPGGGSGLLGRRSVRRMWKEHGHAWADHGTPFWNAMMFELWHRRFMERSAADVAPTPAVAGAAPTRTGPTLAPNGGETVS